MKKKKKFHTFRNEINILNEDIVYNVHIELNVFQVLHDLWLAYWIKNFLC